MNIINIVGIDPGTNFTGVAIFSISLPYLKIEKIDTVLIDVNGLENPLITGTDLQHRLFKIHSWLTDILKFYNPFTVSIESPFINPRRPGAVIPLAQVLFCLEHAVRMYSPYIHLGKFPPSNVKNAIGVKGGEHKLPMLEALLRIKEINDKVNPKTLSEHEIDACAIAYAQLQVFKEDVSRLLL